MNDHWKYYLVISLIFWGTILFAQELPRVVKFSDNNIAQSQVWSIVQGEDQRMYFGTSDGLISFDGCKWHKEFSTKENIIRALGKDKNGNIFSGTFNEYGLWNNDNFGKINYTSLSSQKGWGITKNEEIWHILNTRNATYFQSFSSIYKYANEQVDSIATPGNIMFLQNVNDQLLLQKIDGGIYKLDSNDKFELVNHSEFFSDKKVVFILPFEEGNMLIGTEKNGVFVLDVHGVKLWSSASEKAFVSNQLNKGLRLKSGDYIFGTVLNGIYIVDKNGRIKSNLRKENGLPDNTVLSLCETEDGNLWLGLDSGVALVDLKNPLQFFTDMKGELGTVYAASYFDDIFYLGTNHGVFYKQDKGDLSGYDDSDFQFIKGTAGQVWNFRKLGNELLCGHNEGTFSITKNQATKISDINGGWAYGVFRDDKNTLVQGTYSGLILLRKEEKGAWRYSARIEGYVQPIKELEVDHKGKLWAVHPNEGLSRLTLNEDKTKIVDVKIFNTSSGLPSLKSIHILAYDDSIFVLSEKKWFKYDYDKHIFSEDGRIERVDINQFQGKLIIDKSSLFFEAMPNQVKLYANKTEESSTSLIATLPISLVKGYEHIAKMQSNTYWFCLKDGYALLDLTKSEFLEKEDGLKVNFSAIEVIDGNKSKLIAINNENIELKSHQNRLGFHFFQASFERFPYFRYKMEGLDESWSAWSTESDKEYFYLKPGKYKFVVESQITGGQASIGFTILPHWTQTIWAYLVYFIILCSFIYWMYHLQRRKFERSKILLEEEQQMQLQKQEITSENEKLQLIVLNKSKQLANSAVNLAQKNEILLKIRNELNELKKSSAVHIPPNEYQKLNHLIDVHLTAEEDWELFEKNFNQVHEDFFKKLKSDFSQLTPADLQLAAFLKMNISSKEIAPLFHISLRGVENKRYRLRKKLGLSNDANITEFLMQY